ncbi:MAG: PspA/IM30 family protein [Acidobacteriota bacterium]
MSFFNRLSQLVQADAHGVVDALEDRPLLLRQHLREAEQALAAQRARQQALVDQARGLGTQAERLARDTKRLDGDLELALTSDDPKLQRHAARKLLQAQREQQEVEASLRSAEAERDQLAEVIADRETELEVLRNRVKITLASDSTEGPRPTETISDEEVELELLRRRNATAEQGDPS